MARFQVVGETIEKGANLMSYGKEETEIRTQLQDAGWNEKETVQLLRGMRWRMRTEADS